MSDERSMLDKFGLKPIHVILIVMLAFGGAGSSAIISRYFGLDVDEVKTEIKSHARVHDEVLELKIMLRSDSIVRSYIETDLATKVLAEAIEVDAKKLSSLAKYGLSIMEKDSVNEIWRNRVDEALRLTKVGCGACYRDGKDLWFKVCYQSSDILVKRGRPIGRPDIIEAAWGIDDYDNVLIFPHLLKVKYKENSVRVTTD